MFTMDRKKYKYAITVIVCGLLLELAAGCGPEWKGMNDSEMNKDGVNAGKVTLTFVYAGGDPSTKAAVSDVVEAFMEENPNIEIDQDSSGTASYVDYLQTKDAAGEFPDMMEMLDTQWYADAGRLAEMPEELTRLINKPPVVSGKVYTLPMSGLTPSGFIYNKEIFEQAGITEEPHSWSEFLDACEKIKKIGIAPLVVGGKESYQLGLLMNKLIMDNVLADDPDWNSRRTAGLVSFTDTGFVQAIQDFAELFGKDNVNSDWMTTTDNQTVTVLLSRKAAMLYGAPQLIRPIMAADSYFKIGFFVPGDRKGRLVLDTLPKQGGLALSSSAAQDPDKLEAFKTFVRFFYSPDHYGEFLGGNTLAATSDIPLQELSEPFHQVLEVASKPHISSMQMSGFWGKNAMPPAFRDWFYTLVRQMLTTGSPSIDELLRSADQEWDRLIAERE